MTTTTAPELRGGFGGFRVAFGDGCDDDSVNALFHWIIHNEWTVDLVFADAPDTEVTAVLLEFDNGFEDDATVNYRLFDHHTSGPAGPVESRPFADLVGVTIC